MINGQEMLVYLLVFAGVMLGAALIVRAAYPDGLFASRGERTTKKTVIDGYSECPNCASELREWGEIEPIGMKFITYDEGRRSIDPIMGVKCGNCGHIGLFAPLNESPKWTKKRTSERRISQNVGS